MDDDVELTRRKSPTTAESDQEKQRPAAGSEPAGSTVEAGEKGGDLENAARELNVEQSHEHITGFKLFGVLASVTLAAFLMLLDGSIIGVVSCTLA